MADLRVSIEEIKELMDKLQKSGLGSVSIREADFVLSIKAKKTKTTVVAQNQGELCAAPAAAIATAAAQAAEKEEGNVVKSPIVGTFYASAAPDKPPFVTVGSMVKKGDVICIIESMKLMNEVQSEFSGEVVSIKACDGQALEFGQPILVIK